MKVKDIKNILKDLNDEEEIKFYLWDYQYDKENPEDLGSGKFVAFDSSSYGNCFNIGINK